ncbi:G-protein coupled receptor 4-like isoform X1 [Parambassis ranga]|uniref:G-protein coupled receptor 4-like isoform X1 n=1 Tax=Parambassis ranga TaxID=210632 RepID=A0A6P7JSK4_9TELE|nr:G-protein coupled receptor 4-like isoform X1 [Parambassis ranga]XP_028279919.1 G-protein coupled receptor 4-like isoform X1 [Parambassis ranga]
MEEFYFNTTEDESFSQYRHRIIGCDSGKAGFIVYVLTWIICCVGLPLIIVTIGTLYYLVRKDHVAPVYIINLLTSDIIQLCSMVMKEEVFNDWKTYQIFYCSYYFGLLVSVGFMLCISLERYLVIAHPLWYRYRRTIKSSVIISIVVWVFPLACVLPFYLMFTYKATVTMFSVFLLLPFPLLMFLMGGTLRALSSARSVPSDEKRRIVAILVVVLLIYTMLFLPSIIWSLTDGAKSNCVFSCVTLTLIQLSPLADLTMYVFIRKGAIDNVLSSLCCDKMDSDVDTQHE